MTARPLSGSMWRLASGHGARSMSASAKRTRNRLTNNRARSRGLSRFISFREASGRERRSVDLRNARLGDDVVIFHDFIANELLGSIERHVCGLSALLSKAR